jgi:hypothetical protein
MKLDIKKIVAYLKLIGMIGTVVFTICSFISVMMTINPRVTNLEKRMAESEQKISTIEGKLDILLLQSDEIRADVKTIYTIMATKQ